MQHNNKTCLQSVWCINFTALSFHSPDFSQDLVQIKATVDECISEWINGFAWAGCRWVEVVEVEEAVEALVMDLNQDKMDDRMEDMMEYKLDDMMKDMMEDMVENVMKDIMEDKMDDMMKDIVEEVEALVMDLNQVPL